MMLNGQNFRPLKPQGKMTEPANKKPKKTSSKKATKNIKVAIDTVSASIMQLISYHTCYTLKERIIII